MKQTIQLAAMVMLVTGSQAAGQLIGPIPAGPDRSTRTDPDAPAPSGPAPVVEPASTEPRAPSIVERDASGRLRPLSGTPEQAAVANYPFDEARRTKILASQAARRQDLDRFVVAKLEAVLEVQRLAPKVRAASDFETLFKARDAVAELRSEKPLDRLLRDGAISLEHKVRLEEALREYDIARKKQIDEDAKGDPTRGAVLNLRQTFDDVASEPLASLERQLDGLAHRIEKVIETLEIRDEQRQATNALGHALRSGVSTSIHAQSMRRNLTKTYWLDVLDMEQKRRALIAAQPDAKPAPQR